MGLDCFVVVRLSSWQRSDDHCSDNENQFEKSIFSSFLIETGINSDTEEGLCHVRMGLHTKFISCKISKFSNNQVYVSRKIIATKFMRSKCKQCFRIIQRDCMHTLMNFLITITAIEIISMVRTAHGSTVSVEYIASSRGVNRST